MTLHELGIKHHTDKAVYHLFTVVYETWLGHQRYAITNMLELGVLDGGSIRMWQDYFVNHKWIHAADINPSIPDFGDKVMRWQVDQDDRCSLRKLPGDLDLIVDDGGHTMRQRQYSLIELFNHLKPGGTYILEDLHTSTDRYAKTHGCTPENNTLRLLHDLYRGTFSENNEYFITGAEFRQLRDQIALVDIVHVKDDSVTSGIIKRA